MVSSPLDADADNQYTSEGTFLNHPPNVRDMFRLLEGCSKLPRESAENKKLFTRLWVHEAMRAFYDRLVTEKQKADLFQEIRTCVKTIFRENFDSAFEHLGKMDGRVRLNVFTVFRNEWSSSGKATMAIRDSLDDTE